MASYQYVTSSGGVQSQGSTAVSAPQQPTQQTTTTTASVSNDDPGPIIKFQRLVPTLKQSLSTLMKVAGQVLQQNAVKDTANPTKSTDIQSNQQKLEKSLEDFYSICDQVEINLRLALEIRKQMLDSTKNTPNPVVSGKDYLPPQTQPVDVHTYPQYLNIVRAQINCAKEVHDVLLKFAQQVMEK